MKFLSDILARAGLVVEGAVTLNSVANATTDTDRFLVLDSGVVRFRTGAQTLSDIGGALDSEVVHIAGTETVTGSKTFSAGISLGTVLGATGVIRNLSTDGSLVMGGSAFSNASLPARTIIISTVGTYSALTGAANLFVGRNAGASVTSGNNNVFIGKGAGSGITTGAANVIMSSSDASNLPSNLTNSIHLVAGGGYRLNDASSIPTTAHVFIGGGFGSSTALRDFYFGQLPFTPDAGLVQTHITFYAPSGSGTDISGSNFTIAGGRGTGAGTPGSVIISTSAQGASGSAVQTLVERARFNASGLTLAVITAATTDTDRFLVSDGGVVKFRTGAELLSDIGGLSGNQTITLSGDATGSGTTSIAVTLANSGVTAGTYGNASNIPTITVDAKGRVTSITTTAVSIVTTLAGLSDVTLTSPADKQVLQYNAATGKWVNASANIDPATTSTLGTIIVGAGLSVTAQGVLSVNGTGSARSVETFTATSGQTTFTVAQSYTVGLVDVYLNGVRLSSASYTASNGTTVVLADAAVAGDVIDIVKYTPLSGLAFTSDNVPEGTVNLYFTNARARAAISLTTTGTSGAATYNSSTGVLNIPQYQTALTNPVTGTGTSGYLARFTGTSAIGNSALFESSLAIGLGTASINASALFQMDSTTKGFLPPRMTAAQRGAISSPPVGLVVYQTDSTEGLWAYTASGWKALALVN